jgi:hypothetical protein
LFQVSAILLLVLLFHFWINSPVLERHLCQPKIDNTESNLHPALHCCCSKVTGGSSIELNNIIFKQTVEIQAKTEQKRRKNSVPDHLHQTNESAGPLGHQ